MIDKEDLKDIAENAAATSPLRHYERDVEAVQKIVQRDVAALEQGGTAIETKIYCIIQNGYEKDDRGMSLVVGPANANLDELRHDFLNRTQSDSHDYSRHPFATWRTTEFADWLIEVHGFSPCEYWTYYLPLEEEQDRIDQEMEQRSIDKGTRVICDTFAKVIRAFKEHGKGVSLNSVYNADEPKKLRIGWLIDKGNDNSVWIGIQIGQARRDAESGGDCAAMLWRALEGGEDRDKLKAWLVGQANGDEVA